MPMTDDEVRAKITEMKVSAFEYLCFIVRDNVNPEHIGYRTMEAALKGTIERRYKEIDKMIAKHLGE